MSDALKKVSGWEGRVGGARGSGGCVPELPAAIGHLEGAFLGAPHKDAAELGVGGAARSRGDGVGEPRNARRRRQQDGERRVLEPVLTNELTHLRWMGWGGASEGGGGRPRVGVGGLV